MRRANEPEDDDGGGKNQEAEDLVAAEGACLMLAAGGGGLLFSMRLDALVNHGSLQQWYRCMPCSLIPLPFSRGDVTGAQIASAG
jgi:hypothetical protein